MILRRVIKRGMLVVAIGFLLALAWQSLVGGVRQLPRSLTVWQQLETGVQLVGGLEHEPVKEFKSNQGYLRAGFLSDGTIVLSHSDLDRANMTRTRRSPIRTL